MGLHATWLKKVTYFFLVFIFSAHANAQLLSLPKELKFKTLENQLASNLPLNDDTRYVFTFVSSRCPCSKSYSNQLNDIYKKFHAEGIKFYGVHSNHNESFKADTDYLIANYDFPIIDDLDQKLLKFFKAYKTPHVFVLDGNKVVYHGGIASSRTYNKSAEPLLRTALTQKTPSPSESKTMGCFIKRKDI